MALKQLTLLSRTYCHLCHDMEAALAPLAAEFGVAVAVVDVDADDALEARWGELVPVLLDGDAELCHYFLDAPKVRDYLSQIR
ncbi:MAG TPA: glutaredoxin family protein [Azospira sp.]|nr:glutaredoxin family protein [Azospira sp.]